jgi:O-acetylhomoserine/O-acetylserine sulfhydrylase-like pyridoxal-dependent enzyme
MIRRAASPTGLLKRFGITTTFYDPLIGAGIAELCTERTKAIFMESPGSLTFEVQDMPAIVAVAKARGHRHAARQYLGDAAAAARRSSWASIIRSSPAPNISSAIRT